MCRLFRETDEARSSPQDQPTSRGPQTDSHRGEARWPAAVFQCLFGLAAVLASCSDNGVSPEPITRQDITRAFSAVTFTITNNGTTTDQLALGAVFDITLHEDGSTTGNLFLPGVGEGGEDFIADLAGSFSFDESTGRLAFEQDADTFLRDMTFTAVRSSNVVQLAGEETFDGTIIRLVLR